MFTGLVEEVGVIQRVQRLSNGARLVIGAKKVVAGTKVGDSIAVSGACLTVNAVTSDDFTVECMPETLLRTTIGGMTIGNEVNLERSLALGDRLGGHLVLGHVDAVVRVKSLEKKGDSLEVRLDLSEGVAPLVAEKGSVALDGVSLTIIRANRREFSVGLIRHTIAATTLRSLRQGSLVNLEADVIARYVHRSLESMGGTAGVEVSEGGGLTMEMLREKGFA